VPAYGNLSGKSGVRSYVMGAGFIEVTFRDGSTYRYSYPVTGRSRVDEMQNRARAGYGLNRYITKSVGSAYEWKR
jgi:hypothetical protein